MEVCSVRPEFDSHQEFLDVWANGLRHQNAGVKVTVPMHPALAEVLKAWQAETPYNKPDDFVFASVKLDGKKPRTGNMIVEDYLRPAAIKAGVVKIVNGKT